MNPFVLLAIAFVVCHGNEDAVKEKSKDSRGLNSTERGNRILSRPKRDDTNKSKKMGLPPPDEDLLELMVRIAETPQEWDKIQKVLNALGMEERKSKTQINKEETNNESIVDFVVKNKSQEYNSTIETARNITNHSVTTEYPDIQHVTFKKRKKGNRRKEHFKSKKLDRKHEEGFTEDDSSDRWPKFIQSKKRVRDRRDEEVDDDERWPPPDEWLQPVRFRHGRQDALWSVTENLDWPEATANDKVKWVPTNEINKPDDEDAQTKSVAQDTTRATSNWLQKGNGSWPESARSRAEFSYHRVTANPRERHKATAFVAVSVVKTKAPPPLHKPHPPPWSHARHLHRLQDQLRSISAAKSRLRHHWLEKERLHQSLVKEEEHSKVTNS